MKRIFAALAILTAATAFASSEAEAQCGGQFSTNQFCGYTGAGKGLPGPIAITPGVISGGGGTVLGNPTASTGPMSATTAPVLGIPGTSTGQLGLAGSGGGTATLKPQTTAGTPVILLPNTSGTAADGATAPLSLNATTGNLSITGLAGGVLAGSGPAFMLTPVLGVPGASQGTLGLAGASGGTATITAQATAGSPTITLPNTSGTVADGASSPLVLSATTGNLTCPTCVTSSGGGAITGTAPINVSAAGVVSLQGGTGTVAIGSGGTGSSFSATPTLGVAGSVLGTVTLANLTSGGITVSPPTGALGTVTNTLQAVTDIFVYRGTTDTLTNKTLTSPTINAGALSGTFTGNATFSGNLTLSGNDTFSGQAIHTGTSAPASAAGNTVVLGTLAAVPTLTNTGQAFLFNTTAGGAILQGDGSSDDIRLYNKGGSLVLNVPTGTTVPQLPGLASGTCVNGLALDSSNNVVKASCPGAASSIQVGSTSITSGTNGDLEFNNAGVLGEVAPGNGLSISSGTLGLTAARRTNPTTQTFTSAGSSGTYTTPANVLWIEVLLVGGGGGGSGNSANGGAGGNTCWNTSGAACTSPVYQAGGGSGSPGSGAGGTAGTVSGSGTCTRAVSGGYGGSNSAIAGPGGYGAASIFGSGGYGGPGGGNNAGVAGLAYGSGGGGASTTTASDQGGGSGASCYVIINAPAGTYTYAVGSAGTAGTGTPAGGAGAGGYAQVTEHYN